jgi:hypothetical protein
MTTSKVLFSRQPSPLSQKSSFSGCVFEGLVPKFKSARNARCSIWMKQGGDHDQAY